LFLILFRYICGMDIQLEIQRENGEFTADVILNTPATPVSAYVPEIIEGHEVLTSTKLTEVKGTFINDSDRSVLYFTLKKLL
jgi:hypothetical protein